MLIMLVLLLITVQITLQSVYQLNSQYQYLKFNLETQENFYDDHPNYGFEYGIWTRYAPLQQIQHIGPVSPNASNCSLIHLIPDQMHQNFNLIYFLCLDYDNLQINHKILAKGRGGNVYEISFQYSDYLSYENNWMYTFLVFQPGKFRITIYFCYLDASNFQEQSIEEGLLFTPINSLMFGGSIDIYQENFNRNFQLTSFRGLIFIEYHSEAIQIIDELSEFSYYFLTISSIQSQFWCDMNPNTLIIDQVVSQQQIIYESVNIQISTYSFQGWFKISEISDNQKITLVEFNNNIVNINKIGLVSLRITYHEIANTYIFTIQTYSYKFPLLNINHQTEQLSKIIQSKYSLTQWHYFKIKLQNSILNIDIKVPEVDGTQFYNFYFIVNQYKNIRRNIMIGDQSVTNSYSLHLSTIEYLNCEGDFSNNEFCHFSCNLCLGPTKNDCINCHLDSNRFYHDQLHSCFCKLGYIEVGSIKCKSPSDLNYNMVTFQIPDSNESQDKYLECSFGYFESDQQCYQCPYANEQNVLRCLECIENPKTWVFNPICSTYYSQYDNVREYNYFKYEEKQQNLFLFQNEQLEICNGCKRLCESNDNSCYQSIHYHKNQLAYISCEINYIFSEGECFGCQQFLCQSCIVLNQKPVCLICSYDSTLDLINFQCVVNYSQNLNSDSCGIYCGKCNSYCQYCKNPDEQYLAINRQSCKLCSIQYCKYCFEYHINNLSINSLSQDFIDYEFDEYVQVGCALCQEGYSFNFQSSICEQSNLPYDCVRGILDFYGKFKCLITKMSDFQLGIPQISNCQKYIQNCMSCIKSDQTLLYCVVCEDGYYANRMSGVCLKCDVEFTLNCFQFDYTAMDYWKSDIQSFYYGFLPTNSLYLTTEPYFLRLASSKCQEGYILYQFYCIQACPEFCLHCVIEGYESICVQCKLNNQFQSLSIYNNQCLKCHEYCELCVPRTADEIQAINPYFNSDEYQHYSNKCLKHSLNELGFIYNRKGTVRLCQQQNKCESQAQYNVLLECLNYSSSVYYLANFWYNLNFQILNLHSIEDLTINIQFQFSDQFCLLRNPLFIQNDFHRFIFSLETASINLIGNNNTIFNTLEIVDFQNIHLKNFNFKLQNSALRYTMSSLLGINLSFQNSTFYNIKDVLVDFQTNVKNLTKLTLHNVLISDLSIEQNLIFNLSNYGDLVEFRLIDLTFQNCYFNNSSFIDTKSFTSSVVIEIINLSIINSTFIDVNFFILLLSIDTLKNQQSQMKIIINNLLIQNCNLTSSTIIQSYSNINFDLTNLFIINSNLFNSTFFHIQQSFQQNSISTIKFYFGQFNNLYLTNQSALFRFSNSLISKQYTALLRFQNFNLNQLYVYSSKIFQIASTDLSIELENITIQNNSQLIYGKQSSLSYFSGYYLSLQSVNIFVVHNSCQFEIEQFEQIKIRNTTINYHSDNLNSYYFLDIKNFLNLEITSILVNNLQIIDTAFLKIFNANYFNKKIQIIMKDILFKNIFLTTTIALQGYSLISIQSDVEIYISLYNCYFERNLIFYQVQELSQQSAGLIYINSRNSQILINNLMIVQNTILNTTESLLYINCRNLTLTNAIIQDLNSIDYVSIRHQGLISKKTQPLKTNSGIGLFILETLNMKDSSFQRINAYKNGLFEIRTKDLGYISLQSLFIQQIKINNQIQTSTFLINAEISLLTLTIENVQLSANNDMYSPSFLLIIPSSTLNLINISNIQCLNSYSNQNQFLTTNFPIYNVSNSQIFLKNIKFINDNFTQYYVKSIQKSSSNALIYLSNGHVDIQSLFMQGNYQQPLLEVLNCKLVQLKNISIINVTFSQSNLLQITIDSQIQNDYGNLMISNLQITNFNYEQLENQTKNTLFMQDLTMIYLYINRNIAITIDNVYLQNIQCKQCKRGILYVEINMLNKFLIQNLICRQNQISNYGCLLINDTNLGFSGQNTYLELKNSEFNQNMAKNGSSLSLINLSVNMINCRFSGNKASQFGGAIYFQATQIKNTLKLTNNLFFNNTANFGGAIYIDGVELQESSIIQNIFDQNNGNILTDNIMEQPSQLRVSLVFQIFMNSNIQSGNIEVPDLSKQNQNYFYLPSYTNLSEFRQFNICTRSFESNQITLRLIPFSKFGEQIGIQYDSKCTIQSRIYNQFTNQPLTEFEMVKKQIIFNQITYDYNLDEIPIIFNPYLEENLVLQLQFQCDSLLNKDYQLRINVKTLPCQMGEFLYFDECKQCQAIQGYYSVGQNATKCSQVDKNMIKNHTSNLLDLASGYWRPQFTSNEIRKCSKNPLNCNGGWEPGNPSCLLGHLGALCEECDIYNIQGQGKFIKSRNSNCNLCGYSLMTSGNEYFSNILRTFTSIALSVKSVTNSYTFLLNLKQNTQHFDLLYRQNQDQSGCLIKIFLNYTQILSTIFTFQINFTFNFQFLDSISNPISQIVFDMDCRFSEQTQIDLIYFRLIWIILLPIIYFVISALFYLLIVLIMKTKQKSSVFVTIAIYITLYTQPNLIKQLGQLLSSREISGIYWISGNVQYHYYTEKHMIWIYSFVMPMLIIYAVIIPVFFFVKIYRCRNDLNDDYVRMRWSYLYNEYKQKTYYWESVKIQQRQLLIIILIVFEEEIIIKSTLLFLIVFFYLIFVSLYKPYNIGQINNYDIRSAQICALTLIIASSTYVASLSDNLIVIYWIFQILLNILILLLFIPLIIYLFKAYLKKYEQQFETFVLYCIKKFSCLQKYFPSIQFHYQLKRMKKEQMKSRFKKIKIYLMRKSAAYKEFEKTHTKKLETYLHHKDHNFSRLRAEIILTQRHEQQELMQE